MLTLQDKFDAWARVGAVFHYLVFGPAIVNDKVALVTDDDPMGMVPYDSPRPESNFVFMGLEIGSDEMDPQAQTETRRSQGSPIDTYVKAREPVIRARLLFNNYEEVKKRLRPQGLHIGNEYYWGSGMNTVKTALLRVITNGSGNPTRRLVVECQLFFRVAIEEVIEKGGTLTEHEPLDVRFHVLRGEKPGEPGCYRTAPRDMCHGWWVRSDTLEQVDPNFGLPGIPASSFAPVAQRAGWMPLQPAVF